MTYNWNQPSASHGATQHNGPYYNTTIDIGRSDNNLSQAEKESMLLEQARRGSTPGVYRYITLGANGTNVSDDDLRTSLHYAVRNCLTKSVEWILEVNKDINAIDDMGFTALGYAMRLSPSSKKDRIIKMLRDKGALEDPSWSDNSAKTRPAGRDIVSTQETASTAPPANDLWSNILRYEPAPIRPIPAVQPEELESPYAFEITHRHPNSMTGEEQEEIRRYHSRYR